MYKLRRLNLQTPLNFEQFQCFHTWLTVLTPGDRSIRLTGYGA